MGKRMIQLLKTDAEAITGVALMEGENHISKQVQIGEKTVAVSYIIVVPKNQKTDIQEALFLCHSIIVSGRESATKKNEVKNEIYREMVQLQGPREFPVFTPGSVQYYLTGYKQHPFNEEPDDYDAIYTTVESHLFEEQETIESHVVETLVESDDSTLRILKTVDDTKPCGSGPYFWMLYRGGVYSKADNYHGKKRLTENFFTSFSEPKEQQYILSGELDLWVLHAPYDKCKESDFDLVFEPTATHSRFGKDSLYLSKESVFESIQLSRTVRVHEKISLTDTGKLLLSRPKVTVNAFDGVVQPLLKGNIRAVWEYKQEAEGEFYLIQWEEKELVVSRLLSIFLDNQTTLIKHGQTLYTVIGELNDVGFATPISGVRYLYLTKRNSPHFEYVDCGSFIESIEELELDTYCSSLICNHEETVPVELEVLHEGFKNRQPRFKIGEKAVVARKPADAQTDDIVGLEGKVVQLCNSRAIVEMEFHGYITAKFNTYDLENRSRI